MKIINKKLSILVLILFITSCADLEVINEMQPDAERALSNPGDLINLVSGAAGDVFSAMKHYSGTIHMGLQSDLWTATNNAYGFWHVGDQPRRELVNNTGYPQYHIFDTPWTLNNTAVANINLVINRILDGMIIENDQGEEITQEVLADAYFIRGVALGAIGLVFDEGYAVLEETEPSDIVLKPYDEVIGAALTSFDRALEVVNGLPADFTYTFTPTNTEYSKAYFIQLINSFAARFAISQARNSTQAKALDYQRILKYANNGITEDFEPITDGTVAIAYDLYLIQYRVAADATYIPVDQKIAWLLDPSQPKNYPTGEVVLDELNTNDARYEEYYFYTQNFGYLNASRNRLLFSNYGLKRWPSIINPSSFAGTPVPFMLAAEMTYIKAEAEYRLGNNSKALALINNGPRSTKGNLAPATDDSDASIEHLLHYEYSIELGGTGQGLTWAFMRRHDLLQIGTPLHWPVPARELEVLGLPVYTYGSPGRADGINTADGSNSWLN